MNNNNFDPMPYLQQMNEQFRRLFGDDFVKNLMSSMQMPAWGGGQGGQGNQGGPGGFAGPGPFGSGDSAGMGSNSRFKDANPRGDARGQNPSAPPGADWMNQWMPGWMPFMNQGAGGANTSSASAGFPCADVYQTRHEVVVVMEIPGLERSSDVHLSVFPHQLTVKGEMKRRYQRLDDVPYALSERFAGPFERTIALPARVRRQHAKAVYNAGLLEVRMLKETKSVDGDGSPIDVDFA